MIIANIKTKKYKFFDANNIYIPSFLGNGNNGKNINARLIF